MEIQKSMDWKKWLAGVFECDPPLQPQLLLAFVDKAVDLDQAEEETPQEN